MAIEYKKAKYRDDVKKIGVISDTHIPARGKVIPSNLYNLFEGVDLILHAGDLVDEQVLDEFNSLAPVEAVAGNMDPVMLHSRLGRLKLIEVGPVKPVKIGLLHGDVSGHKIDYDYLLELFLPEKPDVVVFGHLHQPVEEHYNETLFFNPGSLIDPRRNHYPSCGLLHLDGSAIHSEIIYFE